MSHAVGSATVLERLRRAKRVLVTSHRSPDGDALGSELAMAELIRAFDGEAVIVNRDPAADGLQELPGAEAVTVTDRLPESFPAEFDLVVTMECPDIDRPGFEGLDQRPIVNIDHHRHNTSYGELNWLDQTSPAVGEMVWRLFREAGVSPSPEAATNCFAALSTDCGDFRYPNATPRAFEAASEMVAAGAEPAFVAELVHARRSEAAIRLLGEALATLQMVGDGRIAVISADRRAFERANAQSADTEGIINVPRSIAGVRIVAFLKELDDSGSVRISLRSKGDIDVCAVAARLGGGGHTNASGCAIDGDMASARGQLIEVLLPLVEES